MTSVHFYFPGTKKIRLLGFSLVGREIWFEKWGSVNPGLLYKSLLRDQV